MVKEPINALNMNHFVPILEELAKMCALETEYALEDIAHAILVSLEKTAIKQF